MRLIGKLLSAVGVGGVFVIGLLNMVASYILPFVWFFTGSVPFVNEFGWNPIATFFGWIVIGGIIAAINYWLMQLAFGLLLLPFSGLMALGGRLTRVPAVTDTAAPTLD